MTVATPIRVGIIGANPGGSWGASAHIPALRALPQFEITGVCTSSLESARKSAAAFGIPNAFGSAEELAASPHVDAISVCVRVPEHDRLVRAALSAGKHVYCEWPLGVDTAEAENLTKLAEQRGVRHMVGLQARVSPPIVHMKRLIEDGAIGRILAASVRHSGGWTMRIPESMRYLQLASTGANLETIRGGHSIDTLCWVAGEFRELNAVLRTQIDSLEVLGTAEKAPRTAPDQILAQGVLDSGAVADVHIQGGPGKGSGFTLEVNGAEGDLLLITRPGSSGVQMTEVTLVRTRPEAAEFEAVEVPRDDDPAGIDELAVPARNVARLYARFARSLESAATEIPDFNAAVRRHQTLDMMRAASTSGRLQSAAESKSPAAGETK
jgi:predicted dehydrogenase